MIDDLIGRHLYLDANALIAMVEYPSTLAGLQMAIEQGDCLATTSQWSLGEVLVRPMQMHADGLIKAYRRLLSPDSAVAVHVLDADLISAAAELAASTRMALPDCVHVVTAKAAACDLFLSDDKHIRLPDVIERRPLGFLRQEGGA